MLILAKDQAARPRAAATPRRSSRQMADVLGTCADEGHQGRVATPAASTRPGAPRPSSSSPPTPGSTCTVAYVEGDDLIDRLDELRAAGIALENLDTGEKLDELGVTPVTANAYLGAWGIVEALHAGRRHRHHRPRHRRRGRRRARRRGTSAGRAPTGTSWPARSWPATSSSAAPQCTGGNYAFFEEVPGIEHLGLPDRRDRADGSFVITKHPGHRRPGHRSAPSPPSCCTRSRASQYLNPDVTVRASTPSGSTRTGADRVRVHNARGAAGPDARPRSPSTTSAASATR